MDLSTLSDADLEALAGNNMQGMSEAGLNAIANYGAPASQSPAEVPRRTQNEQVMSPFMSAVTGFNTGVGRLAHGILQPLTESGLLGDRVAQGSRGEAARREADYQMAANANPKTAGISEFVGNVAPTLLIPGLGTGSLPVRLAKGVATGAGIGAGQYVNPGDSRGVNALFGAAGGGVGAGLGEGLQAGLRYGNKLYAQSAMPGLVERATESLKKHITPEKAMQSLQNKYQFAAKNNENNWAKTNEIANTLDTELKMRGHPFNGSRFIQDINKGIEKIEAKEPAKRAKYNNAIAFANYIKEQTPQSFSGAVTLRQNLNQELKKYLEKENIKTADKATVELVGNLKKILDQTVKDNKKYVAPSRYKKFVSQWSDANQSHSGLQEFFKSPNTEGVLRPVKQRRETLEKGTLDRAALGKYLKPSLGGTTGINQLNKLTGNNNAARSYIMRNAIEGRGQPNEALRAYEKLSMPQREALFAKTPYGENLKAASAVRNNLGEAPREGLRLAGHHALSLGLPGFLGFLGAKTAGGQDWDTSIAAGLGAAALAKGGQGAIAKYASPQSVMRAIQRTKAPSKNAGRFLSPELASLFSDRTPEAQ
jgi:hypothetical protein